MRSSLRAGLIGGIAGCVLSWLAPLVGLFAIPLAERLWRACPFLWVVLLLGIGAYAAFLLKPARTLVRGALAGVLAALVAKTISGAFYILVSVLLTVKNGVPYYFVQQLVFLSDQLYFSSPNYSQAKLVGALVLQSLETYAFAAVPAAIGGVVTAVILRRRDARIATTIAEN